jgi:hypothetical protein
MRLSWSLLVAALASPLAAAESSPLADATYQMVLTMNGSDCPSTWIFKDGQVFLPQAAPYTLARDSSGILVTWRSETAAGNAGAGFQERITTLAFPPDADGNGVVMASAGGGSAGRTVTTTYHAHLAADGTLSGSAECFMGRIPGGTVTFAGRRSGPARAVRSTLACWYRMTRSASGTLLETPAVDLDFIDSPGNCGGSGTFMLDGEGSSVGISGDLKTSYQDGAATMSCGTAQAVFTDRGRTLTVNGTVFALGGEHLTIRIPAQGAPTVVAHTPMAAALALDGHAYAVHLSATDGAADDRLTFAGGRLDMMTCYALGAWPSYDAQVQADGIHWHVRQEGGPTYNNLTLELSGLVAGGHLTGHGVVTRGASTLLSFDLSGAQQGTAPGAR